MVPVGNGWALFVSGGELTLVGSCPRIGQVVYIGVRDQFRLGGLRSVARILIFIHCLPENQVVLPEYYMIPPPPKMAI